MSCSVTKTLTGLMLGKNGNMLLHLLAHNLSEKIFVIGRQSRCAELGGRRITTHNNI